jgi:hypothetical protein
MVTNGSSGGSPQALAASSVQRAAPGWPAMLVCDVTWQPTILDAAVGTVDARDREEFGASHGARLIRLISYDAAGHPFASTTSVPPGK